MEKRKKIYFASDTHFGLDLKEDPIESEKRFVRWLDRIKNETAALYLLGDIFDYWFEYKSVVPKGHTRVLGKLAEFTDNGIPVYIFTGNHDIWMFDYLPKEIGATIITEPIEVEVNGKRFYLAHGDGLEDPDRVFGFIRSLFRNKFCQWLYKMVHPDLTTPFGYAWSRRNRRKKINAKTAVYMGEENEYLVRFAKNYVQNHDIDYFIFGHRHIMLDLMIRKETRVVILGDWIDHFSFAVFDGSELFLEQYIEDNIV
ncbi:MAG: UDP-2,3-diacylglucosamine diphosphatase [Prevotellaceae bacterium]|jgi:UDP-2,3-diacylglucosamine hydrolase|nr:UDP-2,3-diacylglucosamine diphosphatase [Prevotellaceae bacterium]